MNAQAFLAAIGVCLVIVSPAMGQTFSAPAQLSQHGAANQATVGIADSGLATAIWNDNGFYVSDHPQGGAWSAPASLAIAGTTPTLHVSSAGDATLVTYTYDIGIYATERPAGGAWGASATLVAGPILVTPQRTGAPPVLFVENAAGAAAVAYGVAAGAGYEIDVVRRPAGGAWGAPETVTSTPFGAAIPMLADVAIGAGGDVIVTWEDATLSVCGRMCKRETCDLHAAREASPGAGWSDPGALLAPALYCYVARAAIDPVGRATMLTRLNSPATTISAMSQRRSGAPWSAPVAAYVSPFAYPAIVGVEASARGQATFVVGDKLNTGLGFVEGVDGSIAANAWQAPITIAPTSDYAILYYAFGASPPGGVAAAWSSAYGVIFAAVRPSAKAAWGAVQTLAPRAPCFGGFFSCSSVAAAALNANGAAVVLFVRGNPNDAGRNLFAATD